MKIFFWDFYQPKDVPREWGMFIFNFLILIYVSITLFKTWKYYKRCIFQIVPLSINLTATLLLLFLKLFEKGYEFNQLGHLIQIFTYFLFCYTFALIYTKSSQQSRLYTKTVRRIWNILLFLVVVALFIISGFIISGDFSKNCQQNQRVLALTALGFQAISFIPTWLYGHLILQELRKRDRQMDTSQNYETQIQIFNRDIYIKQRKKQIYIVLGVYIVSLILRFVVSLMMSLIDEDVIKCQKISDIIVVTSQTIFGQILLIVQELNSLLPHIVIPIAMYIVPLKKMSKNVKFNSKLILEDDEGQDQQQIQQKITSMISSRLSDSAKPTLHAKISQNSI